jgi:hypothetical protein
VEVYTGRAIKKAEWGRPCTRSCSKSSAGKLPIHKPSSIWDETTSDLRRRMENGEKMEQVMTQSAQIRAVSDFTWIPFPALRS